MEDTKRDDGAGLSGSGVQQGARLGFDEWHGGRYTGLQLAIAQAAWDACSERDAAARIALRRLLDTFHEGRAVIGQPEARGYVLAAVQAGEDALRA